MTAVVEPADTFEADLADFAEEIRELHRQTTIEGIIAIGERLSVANDELSRKGNGKFIAWVESSLPFNRNTANNYIAVYRAFGESEECTSLLHSSTAEALYSLARKSEAVREEAIALADEGERITLAKVKELSGAESSDDKPLTMPRAMLRLQRVLRNIVEWFPKEHREALGNRLIAAGDEILTTGGIR